MLKDWVLMIFHWVDCPLFYPAIQHGGSTFPLLLLLARAMLNGNPQSAPTACLQWLCHLQSSEHTTVSRTWVHEYLRPCLVTWSMLHSTSQCNISGSRHSPAVLGASSLYFTGSSSAAYWWGWHLLSSNLSFARVLVIFKVFPSYIQPSSTDICWLLPQRPQSCFHASSTDSPSDLPAAYKLFCPCGLSRFSPWTEKLVCNQEPGCPWFDC